MFENCLYFFFVPKLDNGNLKFRRKLIFLQHGCPVQSGILVRKWFDLLVPIRLFLVVLLKAIIVT